MVAAMERGSRWRVAGECNWGAAMETGSRCCGSVAADGGGCNTWRQAAIGSGRGSEAAVEADRWW